MKSIHLLLLLLSSMMCAASGATLKPGDPVSIEVLKDCAFLKGEAPKEWEPGKLYFIDCWSTTCGPCIHAMPHVKDLQEKFHEQGLRVISVNVREDDLAKVKSFIAKRDEVMTSPQAFAGMDGRFAKEWLEPAEILGVPSAILVRDGKYLGWGHPEALNNKLIADLLAGGEKAKTLLKMIQIGAEDFNASVKKEQARGDGLMGGLFESLGEEGQKVAKGDRSKWSAYAGQALANQKEFKGEERLALLFMKFFGYSTEDNDSEAEQTLREMGMELLLTAKTPEISLLRQTAAQLVEREFGEKIPKGPGPALEAGGQVSLDALKSCQFIQGEAPPMWEPGKLYLLECWATWCGPCIQAMPHVNDLHAKFSGQGLRVIGMSIMEDDIETVREFVKDHQKDMAFPVGFAGMEGRFVQEWVRRADINSIPTTALVRDGNLLCLTRPAALTDEVVTDLLGGGEKSESALKLLRGKK